jgi:hypothetical protein
MSFFRQRAKFRKQIISTHEPEDWCALRMWNVSISVLRNHNPGIFTFRAPRTPLWALIARLKLLRSNSRLHCHLSHSFDDMSFVLVWILLAHWSPSNAPASIPQLLPFRWKDECFVGSHILNRSMKRSLWVKVLRPISGLVLWESLVMCTLGQAEK